MLIGQVPVLGSPGADALPRAALRYVNTRSALGVMTFAGALSIGVLLLAEGRPRAVALLVIGVVLALTLLVELPIANRLLVRSTSYTVSPDFIYITWGVVFRRSSFIPTTSLLNIETVEGPLLTQFGLVKVRFRGVTMSEVLGPLKAEEVLVIRTTILPGQCRT